MTVKAYASTHGFENYHKRNVGQWNSAWKGGRKIDKDGYVLVHKPDHPNCNSSGYVREHRLVMEIVLGRYLLPTEVVHHKQEGLAGKQNNDPSNLYLYETNAEHLADTLKGKCPDWTSEGKARILNRSMEKTLVALAECNRQRKENAQVAKAVLVGQRTDDPALPASTPQSSILSGTDSLVP